ncbi:MAG TPA: glycine cleavage system aminomethyltransferase GcvT [Phycisphaerales bacterium]|nr:glycine cleavage system aminomethyltransferase GcvT [Phycisphaerales bacterium]
MHKTPLYQFHLDQGAKMVPFAGWEMPLTYFGLTEEHHQVRTSGGFFDVSHMGRVKVAGRHARRFLERICTRKITDMVPGQCRYSLVCNEQGGVKDDVIVYRLDDDEFLVVVNASNREKLLAHFSENKGDLNFKIDDQTMSTAMVALQGPKVMDLVAKVSSEVPTLKKYRFAVKNLMIAKLIVSRTGYTGEDGVEVILPNMAVGMAMKLLLADIDMKKPGAVIRPAGLGARDTLRVEAGMPLYGHELNEEFNALSCGVDFAIAMDKDQDERGEKFIGMEALKRTQAEGGPARKLAGFFIEGKRSARQGMEIKQGGKTVGVVTSGCPSPTLGKCIAMGFLDKDLHAVGTKVEIDTGKGVLEAAVTTMPFYKAAKKV